MKKFFLLVVLIAIGMTVYYFFPESSLPGDKPVERLELYKAKKIMIAYAGNEVLKTYAVSLGKKGGRDRFDDEDKLPDGEFVVADKNKRSSLYKSIIFISRQEYDEIQNKSKPVKKGGPNQIHGMKRGYGFIGKFHRWVNWTKGGIALTDQEIDDLFRLIEPGTQVIINP
jgi:murein L,D-transpeptidase YafK